MMNTAFMVLTVNILRLRELDCLCLLWKHGLWKLISVSSLALGTSKIAFRVLLKHKDFVKLILKS